MNEQDEVRNDPYPDPSEWSPISTTVFVAAYEQDSPDHRYVYLATDGHWESNEDDTEYASWSHLHKQILLEKNKCSRI